MDFCVLGQYNEKLRSVIHLIADEGLTDDNFYRLCMELKFSNLMVPSYYACQVMTVGRDERRYVPLFTDVNELEDQLGLDYVYFNEDFEFSLRILDNILVRAVDLETGERYNPSDALEDNIPAGFIINPGREEFFIEGELLNRIKKFFSMESYTVREVKEMYDNADNSGLEELLNQDVPDWDEIIMEIGRSTLLELVLFEPDFTCSTDDGIIMSPYKFDIRGCASFEESPVAFTSRKAFEKAETSMLKYCQVLNFKSLVDRAMMYDRNGLVLATGDGKTFMSRDLLIEKYFLIEKHCDDRKLKTAEKCLFTIE